MSFADAVRSVLSKYVQFTGRSRRSEFWYWMLFALLVNIVVNIVGSVLFGANSAGQQGLSLLVSVALLLPGLGVSVRRLHDVGKSGWMLLLALLPIIGWIWLFVLDVTDSQADHNQYGPNPKFALV